MRAFCATSRLHQSVLKGSFQGLIPHPFGPVFSNPSTAIPTLGSDPQHTDLDLPTLWRKGHHDCGSFCVSGCHFLGCQVFHSEASDSLVPQKREPLLTIISTLFNQVSTQKQHTHTHLQDVAHMFCSFFFSVSFWDLHSLALAFGFRGVSEQNEALRSGWPRMDSWHAAHGGKQLTRHTHTHTYSHGCRWETFYIFAYCSLVGNPHLAAKI